jgi:hypothetical protein
MMNHQLCIGIAASNDVLDLAALESGRSTAVTHFPASAIGIETIKGFLAAHNEPMRLAVAGAAALNLALALGNAPGRETFVVSSTVADQPVALARFASRTL